MSSSGLQALLFRPKKLNLGGFFFQLSSSGLAPVEQRRKNAPREVSPTAVFSSTATESLGAATEFGLDVYRRYRTVTADRLVDETAAYLSSSVLARRSTILFLCSSFLALSARLSAASCSFRTCQEYTRRTDTVMGLFDTG